MPLCVGDILQTPPEPCPMFRRGTISALRAGTSYRLRSETPPAGGSARIVPENHAMSQTPSGGRKRPPYIAAARGWQCINASLPPGPLAGRWDHRSLRRRCGQPGAQQRSRFSRPFALHCGRERVISHKRWPTTRPAGGPMRSSAPAQGGFAVSGSAARLPCIVGRAFTPAGGPCASPKGYWQGKAPHPSVG